MLRCAPIVRRDHLLGYLSDAADCHIVEIKAGLLISEEAAVEHVTFVAAIGSDHGKATRQRGRLTRGLRTRGQGNAAVQPAAALKQETAVPLIWKRKRETDAVRLPVRSGALIDHAL